MQSDYLKQKDWNLNNVTKTFSEAELPQQEWNEVRVTPPKWEEMEGETNEAYFREMGGETTPWYFWRSRIRGLIKGLEEAAEATTQSQWDSLASRVVRPLLETVFALIYFIVWF